MKYSRNRNGMTAPQTFDVDNVNVKKEFIDYDAMP